MVPQAFGLRSLSTVDITVFSTGNNCKNADVARHRSNSYDEKKVPAYC